MDLQVNSIIHIHNIYHIILYLRSPPTTGEGASYPEDKGTEGHILSTSVFPLYPQIII